MHDFTGVNGDTEPVYAADPGQRWQFLWRYRILSVWQQEYFPAYRAAGVYKYLHAFLLAEYGPASSLFQASDGSLYGTLYTCAINASGLGCVYKSDPRFPTPGAVFELVRSLRDTNGIANSQIEDQASRHNIDQRYEREAGCK